MRAEAQENLLVIRSRVVGRVSIKTEILPDRIRNETVSVRGEQGRVTQHVTAVQRSVIHVGVSKVFTGGVIAQQTGDAESQIVIETRVQPGVYAVFQTLLEGVTAGDRAAPVVR